MISVESWLVRPELFRHTVRSPACWLGLVVIASYVVFRAYTKLGVLERIAARVKKLGWHIVVYFEMGDLPDLEPLHATIAAEVVRAIDEALRLRSDDRLRRAVEEGAMISVTDWDRMSISECEDRLLAVLQRRRDGKT